MSTPFNYKHLYYFWVVAKEGGISRAADKLDMAVQTVSAQVPSWSARWAMPCSSPRVAGWC